MPPPCILVGVTSKPFKNWRPLTPVIFEPRVPSSHFKRCEERQWLAILWGFRKSARRRRPRPPAGPMLEVGGASPSRQEPPQPPAVQDLGSAQKPPRSRQVRPGAARVRAGGRVALRKAHANRPMPPWGLKAARGCEIPPGRQEERRALRAQAALAYHHDRSGEGC